MRSFLHFLQKQSVVGLAVGVLLGGSVSKLVTALITDLVNPLVGLVFRDTLKEMSFKVGSAEILWGDFASYVIDFLIVALIAYIVVRLLDPKRLEDTPATTLMTRPKRKRRAKKT